MSDEQQPRKGLTDWSKVAKPLDEVSFPEGVVVKVGGIPFLLPPGAVLLGCAENRGLAIRLSRMERGDTL